MAGGSKDRQNKEQPLTAEGLLRLMNSAEYKNIVREINKPFEDKISRELQTMRKDITKHEDALADCFTGLTDHDNRLRNVENALFRQERNLKMQNLRVSGLTGKSSEDIKNQFVNLVQTNLSIPVTTDDFDVQVRVNLRNDPTPSEAASQRDRTTANTSVMMHFKNVWMKRAIYSKRTKIGRGVFLSEDLPKEESTLFYECRNARKEGKIKSTWTFDLKVYILSFNNDKAEVHSKDHLRKLLNDDRRDNRHDDRHDNSRDDRRDDRHDDRRDDRRDSDAGSHSFLGFTPTEIAEADRKATEAELKRRASSTSSGSSSSYQSTC